MNKRPYRDESQSVRMIGLNQLRSRIENGDDPILVMAMDQRRFESAHIAGSISYDTLQAVMPSLPCDAEIIMYCTGPQCAASKLRAASLAEQGFTNVARFAGGLAEWAAAGLPLVEAARQAS